MSETENIALFLARRQKRLLFWKEAFITLAQSSAPGSSEDSTQIQTYLSTYLSLLSKISKSPPALELAELRDRVFACERELQALYDLRRLATSRLATAEPEPGAHRG